MRQTWFNDQFLPVRVSQWREGKILLESDWHSDLISDHSDFSVLFLCLTPGLFHRSLENLIKDAQQVPQRSKTSLVCFWFNSLALFLFSCYRYWTHQIFLHIASFMINMKLNREITNTVIMAFNWNHINGGVHVKRKWHSFLYTQWNHLKTCHKNQVYINVN